MARSKLTMYFLVEGETEKWYFEWLGEKLTATSDAYWMDFRISTRLTPETCAKRMHPPSGTKIYTVLDFESLDPAHEARFQSILRSMRKAGERHGLEFMLGYTNFSFELWIILHKMPFTRPVYHRKDYLKPINEAYGTSFRSMPHYKKEKNFKRLLSKLTLEDVASAIERAEEIRRRNIHQGRTFLTYVGSTYCRSDPALSIDLVIRDILNRAGMPFSAL